MGNSLTYVLLQELLALLREHNGDKASPLLRFMLRFTLWLSFDPFAWQVARLRGLALDMGQGFDVQLHEGPRCASPYTIARSTSRIRAWKYRRIPSKVVICSDEIGTRQVLQKKWVLTRPTTPEQMKQEPYSVLLVQSSVYC